MFNICLIFKNLDGCDVFVVIAPPRNESSLTDAYANYILDWNLTHFT